MARPVSLWAGVGWSGQNLWEKCGRFWNTNIALTLHQHGIDWATATRMQQKTAKTQANSMVRATNCNNLQLSLEVRWAES